MQVFIAWENGKSVIVTMPVVPNLAWPILFGQNQLCQTNARIQCKDLKVNFADSALGFEVSCYDSTPLHSFPVLHSSKSPPYSSANITCLLTSMLVDKEHLRKSLCTLISTLLPSTSFLDIYFSFRKEMKRK